MVNERRFGIVLLVLVVSLAVQAVTLPFVEADNGTIGAGMFPSILSLGLIVGLLVYIVRLSVRIARDKSDTAPSRVIVRNQVIFLAAVVLAIVMGGLAGLLVSSAVVLLVSFVLLERLSWQRSILVTGATVLLAHLVFDVALGLNLTPTLS